MIVRLASFLALLSGCMLGVAAHRQQGHLQPHSMLALRAQIDVQCCPKKCGCSKDIPPLAPEYRDGGTDSHGKPLKDTAMDNEANKGPSTHDLNAAVRDAFDIPFKKAASDVWDEEKSAKTAAVIPETPAGEDPKEAFRPSAVASSDIDKTIQKLQKAIAAQHSIIGGSGENKEGQSGGSGENKEGQSEDANKEVSSGKSR